MTLNFEVRQVTASDRESECIACNIEVEEGVRLGLSMWVATGIISSFRVKKFMLLA